MHVHNIIASKSPTTGLPLLIYMWEESPGTIFSGPKGSSDHPSPDLYVELSSFIPFYHHKSQVSLPPLLYSAILQPSWELAVLSPEKLIMWVMNFYILSGGVCYQSQYPNRIAVEGSILLCGVMAAIGPKSRILRCCPLPPGVSSLFFGFCTGSAVAGEHALWAPAVWLACAFALLLCATFVSAC